MGPPPTAAPLPPATAIENGKPTETNRTVTVQPKAKKYGEEKGEWYQPAIALTISKKTTRSTRHHAGVAAQTRLRGPHVVEETLVRSFRILLVLL